MLAFRLQPHFYQTIWFYLLIGFAFLTLGFTIYRLRVRQLLKREEELQRRVDEAVANVKVLSGLIPICASCKKIRDDEGFWKQLEEYIHDHSEAQFSHGICQDCKTRALDEFYRSIDLKKASDRNEMNV